MVAEIVDNLAVETLVAIDRWRAKFLSWTMRFAFLRRLWRDRTLRVSASFAASTCVYLLLACAAPLWVLALGPAVYGAAHLLATMRFTPQIFAIRRGKSRSLLMRNCALIWACAAALRVVSVLWPELDLLNRMDHRFSEWQTGNAIELMASFASLAIIALWTGTWRVSLLSWTGYALLATVSLMFPAATVGALILAHNFVGFYYWWAFSHSQSMRRCALISLMVFTILTLGILFGALDTWLLTWTDLGNVENLQLEFAGISIFDIGSSLFPEEESLVFLLRGVVAYAFGQSMHYFVWLRAIPEAKNLSSVPISWRHTWRNVVAESGLGTARCFALMVTGFAVIWFTLKFPTARLVYFAVAAMHGYLEIVGLFVNVSSKLTRSENAA